MFKWLLSSKKEINDNKFGMFDLDSSNTIHSINDPPNDDWQKFFEQD